MRPVWSGIISFGLVNIPVNLYPAVKPEHVEMKFLRKEDQCPIQYKKVCATTGEEVPFKDIVKGYEYKKNEYVILDEKDLEKADVKRTYSIEIEVFVGENEIDPKYVEKPYYLEPQKKAHQGYALFRDALLKTKKAGIGKFVLRNREHLVMLKAEDDVLLLIELRFADVLKGHKELDIPANQKLPANQLNLAVELIEKLSGKFCPGDFKDTYNEKLKSIIEAKKKGKTVHVESAKPEATTSIKDIMATLKRSLAAVK